MYLLESCSKYPKVWTAESASEKPQPMPLRTPASPVNLTEIEFESSLFCSHCFVTGTRSSCNKWCGTTKEHVWSDLFDC
jgi:hypothetical protein